MHDPHTRAATAYMHQGAAVVDQRQLEANVLLKAANLLDAACREPQPHRPLEAALLHNRKLWTVFAAEAADGAGRLPNDLRNNIGSIAIFVFRRTLELMGRPEPAKVDALIEINRTIAAGLMSRAGAAVSAPGAAAGAAGQAV
ncbi:MAG: flagellar biosynthesis regulator FlaF [Defluviicoccus sp.]|nr:flagellar biosynthesis regulator FlaF [Defluviicoccus sp.]MDG4592318.1 flagellar biosynthesis regulator FlaF [Defluviicoccus sp.]MDS4011162.1 flagellar biosynthesis regulator FlaF [Defluviicoccus sp.]MDS4072181.1 flagellar biosynthesis regulator FlaF [Defluviicoccus sp.]